MCDNDDSAIPQWKKELIARLHKNKCSSSTASFCAASHHQSSLTSATMVQMDDEEDLKYGPGIVNRLRNKYLSLALRAECPRPTILRKSASLENILDEPPKPTTRYRNPVRGTPAAQRARSVEVISRGRDVQDAPERAPEVPKNRPKRIQPVVSQKEKPPQDVVKQAKMIFERRPEHRTRPPHHTGEVAAKVATYKNIIRASKTKPQIKIKPTLYPAKMTKITSPIPDVSTHGDVHHHVKNGLSDTPDLIMTSSPILSNSPIAITDLFLREERNTRTPSPIESKVEERRHFFEEAAHSPKSKKTFHFHKNNFRSFSPVESPMSPPIEDRKSSPKSLNIVPNTFPDLDNVDNNSLKSPCGDDVQETCTRTLKIDIDVQEVKINDIVISPRSHCGEDVQEKPPIAVRKNIESPDEDVVMKRPATITRRKNVTARPAKDLTVKSSTPEPIISDAQEEPHPSLPKNDPERPSVDDGLHAKQPKLSVNTPRDLDDHLKTAPFGDDDHEKNSKSSQNTFLDLADHLDGKSAEDDVHMKPISPQSQQNISKQASNSVKFNFVQNQNVLHTATPPNQPLKVEVVVNGGGNKLSAMVVEKNTLNSCDDKVAVSDKVKKVLKVKKPARDQPENNSIVFKFTDRKDVPDYVQNDGIKTVARMEKPKVGEGGIILLPGASLGESFTDDDEDELMKSLEAPPSPCDVTFINDNVLIDGKSSLSRKSAKKTRMKISFVEAFPEIFEYPSEASLLIELDTSSSAQLGHQVPSITGTSSLATYTPKSTEEYHPGVTRNNIPQVKNDNSKELDVENEEENNKEEPMLFSAGTNSDILF